MFVSGQSPSGGISLKDQEHSEFQVPAAVSDTGCERELNEDRYAVIECPSGIAWIVCDGMGGVSGGELAAQLAIDSIRRNLEGLEARNLETAMRSAIQEANRVIVLRRQNPAFGQMGTTVVAALFDGPEVVIGHAGDSRAYIVRNEEIQSLTTDHTYVQELVDKGQITPEEALAHPQAHILTRCLGSQTALEVSLQKFWIWKVEPDQTKDLLVLCSDGLYSLVNDDELAQVVSREPPEKACMSLVEMARERGGYDNITVAIIPLTGQLRNEPPVNKSHLTEKQERKQVKAKLKAASVPTNWSKILIFIFLLTLLSFLATVSFVLLVDGK